MMYVAGYLFVLGVSMFLGTRTAEYKMMKACVILDEE